jgi:hypothetical protein
MIADDLKTGEYSQKKYKGDVTVNIVVTPDTPCFPLNEGCIWIGEDASYGGMTLRLVHVSKLKNGTVSIDALLSSMRGPACSIITIKTNEVEKVSFEGGRKSSNGDDTQITY